MLFLVTLGGLPEGGDIGTRAWKAVKEFINKANP